MDVLHAFLYLNTQQCLRVHPITALLRTQSSESHASI